MEHAKKTEECMSNIKNRHSCIATAVYYKTIILFRYGLYGVQIARKSATIGTAHSCFSSRPGLEVAPYRTKMLDGRPAKQKNSKEIHGVGRR